MPNTEHKLDPDTGIILVAAGNGSRFGGDKIWAPLMGKPLVSWSLKTCLDSVPGCLVLVHSGDADKFSKLDQREYKCVRGGHTRRQSVIEGLNALPENIKHVLIHDAARPGLEPALIEKVRNAIDGGQPALPVLALTDTIREIGHGKSIDRNQFRAAQTPQGFSRSILVDAILNTDKDQTDEIEATSACGLTPIFVEGSARNLKITYPQDLQILEAIMRAQMVTTIGHGFDVHRFCAHDECLDRQLKLGGIIIPGARALSGHSDADVLLHALCDGIYGAIGDGDIGTHFPPTEDEWKDQDSTLFLEHALGLIHEKDGELVHIDLTLICEEPKLRPFAQQVKERLSALTKLDINRIGLKATTTEQLGFTGRREGIAAQALVTLRVPV